MGYAQISGGPRSFRFRIDPHAISWDYSLNTSVRETIGGQVIQLLSVSLGNLRIEASSGSGGEIYKRQVIEFCRDLALWQRDNNRAVTFSYSPRNISLRVFFQEIGISDKLDNVARNLSISFAIDEDVSGSLRKVTMTEALERLAKGVGYDSPGLLESATAGINLAGHVGRENYQKPTALPGASGSSKSTGASGSSNGGFIGPRAPETVAEKIRPW